MFDTYQNLFKTRFNSTINDECWFTIATYDAVEELKHRKAPQSIVTEKNLNLRTISNK